MKEYVAYYVDENKMLVLSTHEYNYVTFYFPTSFLALGPL